ncbi:MAG: menaquinone biosynthesis decarboxylase [Bacteroidales bacterium]|jgi:4-hydroxy-3-polyprenylbenzoate decarboxylase|nr:menaquinone biosynthesis decarboxylase [Bacteroidales bacterium]
MVGKSLFDFVAALESEGELLRVTDFVSPRLEITEIADRMVKHGGPALLFENNGTAFPLLINAYASDRRICMALGVNHLDDISGDIEHLFHKFTDPRNGFLEKLKILPVLANLSSWFPKSITGKGACQEIVMEKPDLSQLPVLTCWPADGGPFITLPCVHTKDPESGIRNLGMYRMQVFGPDLTGMHWHLHKGSAHHYDKYKRLGRRMPVTVTLGGDPVYAYTATAPLPENLDEYFLAGFLRRKKVCMVHCLTNELEVPSDVDFVIEGYIDPSEDFILEGPFGDHTGFYSLAENYPRFHVTCITHRKNAIYPATIVGIPPQEDGWLGKATEHVFRLPIKMTVAPEIENIHMPVEGVFHNIALVSIEKMYPGQAPKIMSSLWGAGQMMFNKIMVVVDAGTDLYDYRQIARIISAKIDPLKDVHFLHGPADILDHSSSQFAYGSKVGIDATAKLQGENTEQSDPGKPEICENSILQAFPEIRDIRSDLLSQGISLVIISFRKTKKSHVRHMASKILRKEWVRNVKFILFTDDLCDLSKLSLIVWLTANNLDPMRDCFYLENAPGVRYPIICLDGTRKTRELDDFNRDWPNIIVMDDTTIKNIDKRWESLHLGSPIPSPSLQFKSLVINDGPGVNQEYSNK